MRRPDPPPPRPPSLSSPNMFKVYTNGMIVAVEAVRQGVTVGGDTVSGLMFADFAGISETPEDYRNML